jgi:glycine amidinotransferase
LTASQRIDQPPRAAGPVSSHTEWDPLEEIVVGRAADAALEAAHDLDDLARRLEAEGVRVRRPDAVEPTRAYATADWQARGVSAAAPRDAVVVIGSELIETPLPWRGRYFDTDAYRTLFLEYFRAGAHWTAAPRPDLKDALYEAPSGEWLGNAPAFVVNETEPVLAASDVVRCGRDLFALRSPVSNRSGIEWLRRHLGDAFRVHEIETSRPIDARLDEILLPMAPGKILVRGDVIDRAHLPAPLRSWELLPAPAPDAAGAAKRRAAGLAHGVLGLDGRRVFVEASRSSLIEALRGWGFEPIPARLRTEASLGGSLRRATLDVRRSGELASYV